MAILNRLRFWLAWKLMPGYKRRATWTIDRPTDAPDNGDLWQPWAVTE